MDGDRTTRSQIKRLQAIYKNKGKTTHRPPVRLAPACAKGPLLMRLTAAECCTYKWMDGWIGECRAASAISKAGPAVVGQSPIPPPQKKTTNQPTSQPTSQSVNQATIIHTHPLPVELLALRRPLLLPLRQNLGAAVDGGGGGPPQRWEGQAAAAAAAAAGGWLFVGAV